MCQRSSLANRYADTMTQRLGWQATVDEDGDVVFRHRDTSFLIRNSAPGDPEFLCVTARYEADASDADAIVAAASTATFRTKTVKVIALNDGYLVASESFIAEPECMPSPAMIAAVLPRAVAQILGAQRRVAEAITLAGIEEASREK